MDRLKKTLPTLGTSWLVGRSRDAQSVRREAWTAGRRLGGDLGRRRPGAAWPAARGRRTTWVTSPIISALPAEMRSCVPISVIRMTSPNGMRAAMRAGSKTAGMP